MKPISKYVFEKKSNTVYLLKDQFGENLKEFTLNSYKRGAEKGKKNISYKSPEQTSSAFGKYEKVFNIQNKKGENGKGMFTGVNFTELNPFVTYGDSRSIKLNHALIIRFSDNWETLEILFYENVGNEAKSIFERFLKGEISDVCESDSLEVLQKEKDLFDE